MVLKRLGLPGPYEVHPRSYYTYRLRGVVVHTGTANQGHYFSYIRHPSIPDPGLDNQATHASSHGASANPVDTDTPMPPPPPAGSPSTTSLSLSVDGSAGSGSAAGDEAKEAGEGLDGATTPSPISCPAPDDPPGGVAQDVDDVVASEVNVSADVEEAGDTDDDDWCEFNDTIVKEWRTHVTGDVSKDGVDGRMSGLEADCFGGQQNMQVRLVHFHGGARILDGLGMLSVLSIVCQGVPRAGCLRVTWAVSLKNNLFGHRSPFLQATAESLKAVRCLIVVDLSLLSMLSARIRRK